MKILVVAAMPNEMKTIREGIKSADLKMNLDIDFLCCGMGNYDAILSLEHYLSINTEPVFIWNIGICGYWNPKNQIKSDLIQVSNVMNIHTEKEMIIPPFVHLAPLKTCFCSENVVCAKPKFKRDVGTSDDEMYFDMECRGIEYVASRHKLPRLFLKVPFDFVGGETELLEKDKASEKMKILLSNLTYHDYLQKILGRINNQD